MSLNHLNRPSQVPLTYPLDVFTITIDVTQTIDKHDSFNEKSWTNAHQKNAIHEYFFAVNGYIPETEQKEKCITENV